MEITLKRKADESDHDPLVLMVEDEDAKKKHILKVNIGETISLPDHIAHKALAQYKGCFEIKIPEYKTKVMKAQTE